MRFAGGSEIFFDTEMDSRRSAFEPASASFSHILGFRALGQPDQYTIKGAGAIFSAHRHRNLYVM